ncbi:NlpC/P60 family protein [Cellulomonas soli]
MQQVGEAYTQALADADAAQAASLDAAAQSKEADAKAEEARRELAAIARQIARTGGSADALQSLLSSDGFEDVARRSGTLDRVSGKADQAVQQFKAAQLVATTLAARATAAADEASAAKDAAQSALETAQQAQSDAEASVAGAAAERDQLLTVLAAARQTSIDVERQRQDQLDAERRARTDAAAQAARLAAPSTAAPAGPAAGGSTPPAAGTGTPAASTPPATTPPATTNPPATTPPATTNPAPSTPAPTTPPAPTAGGTSRGSAAQGQAAVEAAKTKLGLPYLWGGVGPSGYDCSGLTSTSWRTAGVSINRTSRDQYTQVLKISYDQLRPGDLVFWADNPADPSSIYHVAMWVGDGKIIEAKSAGKPVQISSMRWSGTMPYAGRP